MDFFENVVKEKVIYGNQEILKDKEAFNIAFGIDANFATGMGVLMYSMTKHCKHNQIYHVFTDSLFDRDVERLKLFGESNDSICIVIYYINPENFDKLPTNFTWSKATYYRFLIQQAMSPLPKKILYIDADILCLNDFSDLFSMDDEKIACVVADGMEMVDYAKSNIGFIGEQYFNAGMLMINVDKWVEANIADTAVDMLNKRDFKYCDQDVLNLLLTNKAKFIEKKYNNLYHMAGDKHQVPENTVFVHLSGSVKPWQEWGQFHFMTKRWLQYKNESEWKDEPIIQPTTYKQAKFMARTYKRNGDMVNAIKWKVKYGIWKMKGRK